MVFESLVVDLVNRYLGDFIENLDTSQLKIGIWGGDVVLNNLFIRANALADLELPIKILHGNLGKLTLKIPWKNLYGEPTVATLEGLYIVAVPNAGVKYNAEKEEKATFESKQKELERIEAAKRAEAEKNKAKNPKQDSFAEKLATNVIKNLQVNISDIHVRYEDAFTNPRKPFSIGVTLKELAFQTTDEHWVPKVIKESVSMIYKMVKLEGLAVYWNSNTASYLGYDKEQMLNVLKGNIACPGHNTTYQYLIEPISSSAHLRLNTKPENDNFTIPKILLEVIMEQIAIGLQQSQYHDVLEMLESMERMNLASKYRQYRPHVAHRGNSKVWWQFAYTCIMEETVIRRHKMWSWDHILDHRRMCRAYKEAYKKKISSKKVNKDIQAILDDSEKKLSVFNLTLVRQQAEMEPSKKAKKKEKKEKKQREKKEKKSKKEPKSGGGWLGGWFGGGAKANASKEDSVGAQFEQLMTPEEKAKLYTSIGYQENAVDPNFPPEFVANKIDFQLKNLVFSLKDADVRLPRIMNLELHNLGANIGQRPAANAIKVETHVESLSIQGAPPGGRMPLPIMVSSQAARGVALLDALFETAPLDGECDTRIRLNAQPLEVIYNAKTINQIADFFKPPESVHLKQLQAAAVSKLEDIKEQTATGLQHAINQRKVTEINVSLRPTHVIVPDTGVYRREARMLVLDLGELTIGTEKQDKTPITPSSPGAQLDLNEVIKKAYDKFNIRLKSVQLLYANQGEDWKLARTQPNSHLHILRPMALSVDLSKCMIDDIRIPKMRVSGELPALHMVISDRRLEEVLSLAKSIPLPTHPVAAPETASMYEAPDINTVASEGDAGKLVTRFQPGIDSDSSEEEFQDTAEDLPRPSKKELVKQDSQITNTIDLELKFVLKELSLTLCQRQNTKDVPMLKLVVEALGAEVKKGTFDMSACAYLGGIYLQHMQFKAPDALQASHKALSTSPETGGPLVNLINTPITDEQSFKLLTVNYVKANKHSPEFATTYDNTEQRVEVHFTALEVLLHQEAILGLMQFAQELQDSLALTPSAAASSEDVIVPITSSSAMAAPGGGDQVDGIQPAPRKSTSKVVSSVEMIDMALTAKLDVFSVGVCTQHQVITEVKIKGIETVVTLQKSKTSINASLKDITVYDPTDGALYPKILTFEGGEVFHANVVAYNGATNGENYSNMKNVDTSVSLETGCMKVIFLNKFVGNVLGFLDQFQAAKSRMVEAGAAVKDSATSVAQDLSAKASRIQLSIRMKAPVIVIPQNSTSANALVVDLGHLSISNSFTVVSQMSSDGYPGVLDKMIIELTSLKMSRMLMMGTEVRAECLLLEPLCIRLGITRNLSASWYHGHPDVEVAGKLQAFNVGLSQGDFATAMRVLDENLGEGPPKPTAPPTPKPTPSHQQQVSKTTVSQPGTESQDALVAVKASKVSASPPSSSPSSTEKSWVTVKVNFMVESIQLELYNGDSSLSSGFSAREVKSSLGKIELLLIGLNLSMRSDTAIEAKVVLNKTVLDDTRPGHEDGITQMIEHTKAGGADPPNMIDLTFVQQSNRNKDVDMHVTGIYVCVCPEYLMTIATFFTDGLAKPSETKSPPLQPAPSRDQPPPIITPPPVAAPPAEPMKGEMNVRLVVDRPEIMLVEDPMNINTNALILNVQMQMKMRVSAELQQMQAEVQGLQVISCIYAPEKRDASKAMILNPTDISVHSNAPEGKGQHISVMVTDIILNVSPASIRTISATLSSLSKKKDEEEAEALEVIPDNLWAVTAFKNTDFSFLNLASDKEVEENLQLQEQEVQPARGELLMLQVKSIVVKMSGGVGQRTVPFIITEMSFNSEVRDWTSKLTVSAELCLEVAYYNEKLAVWEPIIEPVQDGGRRRPWELNVKVLQNDIVPEDDTEDDTPSVPPAKMLIRVASLDMLQTTITKSCLDVLTNLGRSFGDAYKLIEIPERLDEVTAPYAIKNESGVVVNVKLDESFKVPESATAGQLELYPGDVSHVDVKETAILGVHSPAHKSIIRETQEEEAHSMYIMLMEYGMTRELRLMRAERRAFAINQKAYPGDPWHLVCQTDVSYGCKSITIRSILQVRNHLPFAVELYYKLSDSAMGRCGEVEPNALFNVPLDAVYAAPYELFFKPRDSRYHESREGLRWKNVTGVQVISCEPAKREGETGLNPMFLRAEVEVEDILFEATGQTSAKCYLMHLHAPLVFRNLLPFPVTFVLHYEPTVVEPGDSCSLLHANLAVDTVQVTMEYLGRQWQGLKDLEDKPQELSVWSFEMANKDDKQGMDLGVYCSASKGFMEISLYCPYWMMNKTGRSLEYRATDEFNMQHPDDMLTPLLFSFKSKSFFAKKKDKEQDTDGADSAGKGGTLGKKGSGQQTKRKSSKATLKKTKASLRISDSEWSDKFSLDTVGSSGTVSCKFKGYNFEVVGSTLSSGAVIGVTVGGVDAAHAPNISPTKRKSVHIKVGVKISLAANGLTKVVTFSPYYKLINQAKYLVSVREVVPEATWCDVVPGSCMAFWPTLTGRKQQLVARIEGSELETLPFSFHDAHTSLLKLDQEHGGLCVDCQVMESTVNVVLQSYRSGQASVRLLNNTQRAPVEYGQKEVKGDPARLLPGETVLYTWQDPLLKRELLWSSGEKCNVKDDLVKDGMGEYFFDSDTKVYWVSFLDGMQRILMFTDDIILAMAAQQAGELEQVDQEIELGLHGIGLSLVNNHKRQEVAYLAITSSGAIWEEKKKKRYKALKLKHSLQIEEVWNNYELARQTGQTVSPRIQLNGKLEVDFEEMRMYKPHKCAIRRTYEDGVWLQFRTSAHQTQLHFKIHRLQLDNQLPGAVFPTVLAPIPPPKSVAAESVPKPFTEVSVMIRKRDFSNVLQFKYAKVLTQEMAVKVDQGFLFALMGLFAGGESDPSQEKARFQEDCKALKLDLMADAVQSSSDEQKHFYDMLHVSPLKIHLSFSLYGADNEGGDKPTAAALQASVLQLFLQSVGIVLTDIQDVVFKLGYFERKHSFYNTSQLNGEIARHYSQQAIKQMYVLVLGLDVLGNPFGVIRGLAEGIEDLFYEPYQGAIQGPEEFAEGLALGVRSLLGHAVGGAAGAVSRITGALGKGIATLTMDEDYQRKRREQMNKRPADLKEGLARGGKGLVMGVVDGVTGIVMKPVEGAKEEGVEGFFKGVGKGLVGAFTRPASGVVDFASSSFEGIRRVADMSEEVHRLRPPRHLNDDGIVRPYNFNEAEGNEMLADTEKGKYVKTDAYVAHMVVSKDGKNVLLVTNKRVLFVSKGEIFGHWDQEWGYIYEDLKETPALTSKGLQVLLKEKQKKSFFSSGTVGKLVPIQDKDCKAAEWIVTKMKAAMEETK